MLAAALSLVLIVSQPWFAAYPAQNRNRINGRVATADDKPIENVRVTLLSDRLTQAGVEYTDSSGRFSFENVSRGIYSVLVEPSGAEYERQSVQVEVNPFLPIGQGGSETYRIDFVLRREVRRDSRAAAGDRTVFYQDVPSDAKKQYRRALEGLKKGDFEGTTKALARAIEIFPDYYEALELLGTEYVKARDYQAAIAPLSHAIEVNQDDWRSFYSLGIALIEVKRPGDAVKPLSRAVELNPGWAYTHLRLGIAKGQTENTGEAIEALKAALKLGDEKVPEAYLHLAFVYNKTRQYQEAAQALDSYLKVSRKTGQRPDEQEYYERLLEQIRQKAHGAPKN
jgi:tetratricopeptide (TPR) repeat protein